jgi:hypothetical protein
MDVTITESGKFTATGCQLLALTVSGKCQLSDCVVQKPVTLNGGNLIAIFSRFNEPVSIASGTFAAESCEIAALTIEDDGDELPVVQLTGATKVHGPIIFETGLGQVIKGPDVELLGEVVNGVVLDAEEVEL